MPLLVPACPPPSPQATSALDSANEAAVQAALDNLMVGRTTVVIAHRLSTVVRASQIVVLHKGEAIERGTHAQLAAAGSHYATFMRHQLIVPSEAE
jgi:ATP-binding cassette subfamily B protein